MKESTLLVNDKLRQELYFHSQILASAFFAWLLLSTTSELTFYLLLHLTFQEYL